MQNKKVRVFNSPIKCVKFQLFFLINFLTITNKKHDYVCAYHISECQYFLMSQRIQKILFYLI